MRISLLILFTLLSGICLGQKKIEINFNIENDSTIINYLKEKNIDFSLNQVATLKGIGTFGEYGTSKRLKVPDAYFFNSEGYMIRNSGRGINCSAELKKLEKLSKAKSDPNKTIESFLSDITILDGSEFTEQDVNLYIIITWAKFLASESEVSFNWFSNLRDQGKLNIKVILLNFDVQERWNLTKGQKEHLGII